MIHNKLHPLESVMSTDKDEEGTEAEGEEEPTEEASHLLLNL